MLRVGIMLGPSMSQAWVASLLATIQRSTFATVSVVFSTVSDRSISPSLLSRKGWSHGLFKLYERWDGRRNSSAKSALAPTSLTTVLKGVPIASDDTQVAQLLQLDLDLVLCLSPPTANHMPEGITRYGRWLLDVDGFSNDPDQPPLWPAHSQAEASVTTRLLHYPSNPQGTPRLLYETRTALNPFSLAQSRDPVYWKSVALILRCLKRVAADGESYLNSLPTSLSTTTELAGVPSLGITRFLLSEVSRRFHARSKSFQRATFAKWCVGIRLRAAEIRFDSPENYRLLVSPHDRFYADPFLFEYEDRTWLFFEDFRYPEGKAVISCCELNEKGEPGGAFEVLRLPYHLSYPFIFQESGSIYMIPESRGNRTVSLFCATDFPHTWKHENDLFSDVDMVDATLHQAEDGNWWLFAGVSDGNYSNSDELCVFYADSFRGPWTPHPQNPVISDVRRARPAGRIFRDDNRLIRPSQDCGPAYGYALVFSEIEVLTRTTYREHVLSRLTPELIVGNTANHTYTRTANLETIDRFFIESRLSQTETSSSSATLL